MTQQILIVAHVIVSVMMIAIILIQQGKGAEAGASFGSGASQSVLGATGSVSLLARITTFLTVMFFGLSFALAYQANHSNALSGNIEIAVPEAVESSVSDVPAANADIPVVEKTAVDNAEDVPSN